ncbi:hypothetical protein PENSPDRAFT_695673 [Peniophora sp. CONT]|nr:hypothetical protein PENSPDRAFT_695673 [Peniophora sp. CONT]
MDPTDYTMKAAVALGVAFNDVARSIPGAHNTEEAYHTASQSCCAAHDVLSIYIHLPRERQCHEEPRVSALLASAADAVEEAHRVVDQSLGHTTTLALNLGLAVLAVHKATEASHGLHDTTVTSGTLCNTTSAVNLATAVVEQSRSSKRVVDKMHLWPRARALPHSVADLNGNRGGAG